MTNPNRGGQTAAAAGDSQGVHVDAVRGAAR